MKVLLVKDVEKLGRAGDLKDVSGGFGRNYLIPQGFAVLATAGQIKQAKERIAAEQKRTVALRKEIETLAQRIDGVVLRFTEKVGEQDRLYGSVTNSDIAAKLQTQTGIDVDRRKISLDDPIKRAGSYQVSIRLASGVEPKITVEVTGEDGVLPAVEAAAE